MGRRASELGTYIDRGVGRPTAARRQGARLLSSAAARPHGLGGAAGRRQPAAWAAPSPLAAHITAPPSRRHFEPRSGWQRRGHRAAGATAPQRAAEPAWHRRRRRQRGAARTLVRVAAAAELLQRHHSSQRPMGGGRGGGAGSLAGGNGGGKGRVGGNDGGGVDELVQLLRQQAGQQQQILQVLQGAGGPQRGGGPRGGGGGGGGRNGGYNSYNSHRGTGRAAGVQETRPGDWTCRKCSFGPNFASRLHCFGCGERRGPAAARQGTLSAGPVGAGGLRPILAWGATRKGGGSEAPTFRVPGASIAAAAQQHAAGNQPAPATKGAGRSAAALGTAAAPARAAASGSSGAQLGEASGRSGSGWTEQTNTSSRECKDSDGFIAVASRASRKKAATQEAHQGMQQQRQWRKEGGNGGEDEAMEVEGIDDDAEGRTGAYEEEWEGDDDWTWREEEGEEEHGDEQGDPAELKRRLDLEEATVRMLAREGMREDHPTMVAARAARDEAAEAWRASRTPHPIARRMGWAQRKLDRAIRSQEKAIEELAKFDEQVKVERSKLTEKLGEARDRVSKHKDALEALQVEASAELYSNKKSEKSNVCAKLAGGLREQVAPNVAALAAAVTEGTEAHKQVSLLMAHLESLQSELEKHASGKDDGHEAYHIGDVEGPSEDEWSESHDVGGNGGTVDMAAHGRDEDAVPRWEASGHSRWSKGGIDRSREERRGKGGTDVAAASTPKEHCGSTTSTPPRAMGATGTGTAQAGGKGAVGKDANARDAAEDDEQRGAKHRRGQTTGDTAEAMAAAQDTARALEVMQEHKEAASAGAFGSDAAIQAAARVHAKNVSNITAAAIAQGVQPITAEGHDLITLDPHALNAWAGENLGAAW